MKRKAFKLNISTLLICVVIFVGCDKGEKENNDIIFGLDVSLDNMKLGDKIVVYKNYDDWVNGKNPLMSHIIEVEGNSVSLKKDILYPDGRRIGFDYTLYYDFFSKDYSSSSWLEEKNILISGIVPENSSIGGMGYSPRVNRMEYPSSIVNVMGKTIQDKPFIEYKAIKDLSWVNNDSASLEQRLIMYKDYRFALKPGKNAIAEYTLKYQMTNDTNKSETNYRFNLENTNFTITANLSDSTMDVSCRSCGENGTPKSYRYKMQ